MRAETRGKTAGLAQGLKEGLLEGHKEGRKEGQQALERQARENQQALERQARGAIEDLCEVLGIELTEARLADLAGRDLSGLAALRAHLKQHRGWP